VQPFVVDGLPGVSRRDGLVTSSTDRSHTGLPRGVGSMDHAFGDSECATTRSAEAGTGYYVCSPSPS
jgi:hypothetical protein